MWTTRIYLIFNKTGAVVVHFTPLLLPILLQLLIVIGAEQTAVALNLVTMQSHPHTLEMPDFCLVTEMLVDFRKFGFLHYPFCLNKFYSLI
jgi:hypothetical protein